MARLILGMVIALAFMGGRAMAVEEPDYKVAAHQGAFELRDYPALTVAEVTVEGDRNGAAYKGFRLLAAYIFGANTRRQHIPMTAPVVQTRSQTIPMAVPVLQTRAGDGWVIRFVMPRGSTLETLPRPDNPDIRLKTLPPARLAVVRFSGLIHDRTVQQKTAELGAFLSARGLRAAGPVALAQYNPPWTLWFLRRNELMVEVAPPG